jgi:hypothetical protein
VLELDIAFDPGGLEGTILGLDGSPRTVRLTR